MKLRPPGGYARWLAPVGSIGACAVLLYAQQQPNPPAPQVLPPAEESALLALPPPPALAAPVFEADAPAMAQNFQMALPRGVTPENGLQVKTIWVARAISVLFPEIKTIGGYRQDPLRWHPDGLAIDVMIPNHGSEQGIQLGNQIAGYALANAKRWGVIHVIWRQGFYPGIGAPSWTADYGNETANHFDHVHIATDGGGYPTGKETFYIGSMTPAPQS